MRWERRILSNTLLNKVCCVFAVTSSPSEVVTTLKHEVVTNATSNRLEKSLFSLRNSFYRSPCKHSSQYWLLISYFYQIVYHSHANVGHDAFCPAKGFNSWRLELEWCRFSRSRQACMSNYRDHRRVERVTLFLRPHTRGGDCSTFNSAHWKTSSVVEKDWGFALHDKFPRTPEKWWVN